MQLFYSPDASPSTFTLDADESRHCLRVLRKKTGDHIDVVDGKGNLYHAEITGDKGKLCEMKTISVEKEYCKRHYKVSVGIALPKNNERFEWFLEKATEIGIDTIYTILTKRAEKKKVNLERCRKIIISAMKQSGKAYLPEIKEPTKLSDIISISEKQKFIAVCGMEDIQHLKDAYQKGMNALVIIGPEGDFTEEEVDLSIANGFVPVSLGRSRLRVETAGVVACHAINLLNE